jgi:catechol 2,3-dioxygenase-like lactoylglutathione lyase family enzyme
MSAARITGLNHITLAVRELERSIFFYRDVLGFHLRARWSDGAYLEAGSLWLCLSSEPAARTAPYPDYTHIAFDVSENDLGALSERIRGAAVIWKENRSEGPSVYFLDPDGHKLELHVGSLASRLAHYRTNPAEGVTVLDD